MENIEILATVGIVILIVIAKMIYDKLSVKRRMRSYLKKFTAVFLKLIMIFKGTSILTFT